MKKIILSSAFALLTVASSFGQGSVVLGWSAATNPIRDNGGAAVASAANIVSQLFFQPTAGGAFLPTYSDVGLTTIGGTALVGSPVPGGVSSANSTRYVDGSATGTVNFQLAVWDADYGTTFSAFVANPAGWAAGALYGVASFTKPVATGATPASKLDESLGTFAGLSLQPIPEPSTIALGVLGALVLLFRRRK